MDFFTVIHNHFPFALMQLEESGRSGVGGMGEGGEGLTPHGC